MTHSQILELNKERWKVAATQYHVRSSKKQYFFSFSVCSSETCAYAGMCMSEDGDSVEQCVCHFNCDKEILQQVCGSDGIIYKNHCLMDMTSCTLQLPIYEESTLAKCDGT